MSESAKKFDFGTEFQSTDGGNAALDGPKTHFTAAEAEQLRNDAFAEGEQSAVAVAAGASAQALNEIASHLSVLLSQLDAQSHQNKNEATELALLTGKKIAAEAIANYPISEIEAVVNECIEMLPHEPKLVVMVPEELREAIGSRLQELADNHGFDGKLVVKGSADMANTQCTIEWASGGLARDSAELESTIDGIAKRRLQAEGDIIDKPELFEFKSTDEAEAPTE